MTPPVQGKFSIQQTKVLLSCALVFGNNSLARRAAGRTENSSACPSWPSVLENLLIVHAPVTQLMRQDPLRPVICEANVDERLGMKIIINVRITQGYEKWVELFHSADAVREEYGLTVLAYGHDKDDDSSVYQVIEIESMERMQEGLSNPAIAKMRTDAGVDLDSQRITFLVE